MCSMSPIVMLGIWHWGDWMKRDLDQPIYGQVKCGSPISGRFIAFINEKFIPLIFMCKCTDVYVYSMVDMFMIFLSLLSLLYVCFMAVDMYESQHVFTCI